MKPKKRGFIVIITTVICLIMAIILVKKISFGKPKAEIKFFTNSLETQEINAVLTVDRKIENPEGWTKLSDLEYYKVYNKNNLGIDNIILKNAFNGETSVMSLDLNKISESIPTLKKVTYSPPGPTNEIVTVTVEFELPDDDSFMVIKGGWSSDDPRGLIQECTFSGNYEDDMEFMSNDGHKIIVHINVNGIDRDPPIFEVTKSIDVATNQNVVVTAIADEDVQVVSTNDGWEFTEKRKFIKTFQQNTDEPDVITVKDVVGNLSTLNVRVDNIDKDPPNVSVSKSNSNPTNRNVVVTITSNEALKFINATGWQSSDNGLKFTKEYDSNADEVVTVSDYAGNTVPQHIVIDNINKKPIVTNIKYSVELPEITNNNVIVTIETDRELSSYMNNNGWELINNNFSLQKTFSENKEETITISDIYGNNKETTVNVSNIDNEGPTVSISRGQNIGNEAYYTISADDAITTARSGINNSTLKYAVTNMPSEPEEWNSIENGWTYSRSMKSMETYFLWVSCEDMLGNKVSKKYEISLNDSNMYSTRVKYNTVDDTEETVTATITSKENLSHINGKQLENGAVIDGWKYTINEYNCTLEKKFNKNINQNIELTEENGLKKVANINIKNITSGWLLGDVNQNGSIDVNDIQLLQRHIAALNSQTILEQHPSWKLSEEKIKIGDVNQNGVIDVNDIQKLQRHIAALNDPEIKRSHPDWLLS